MNYWAGMTCAPSQQGKESQDAKSIVDDNPPTGPPHGQILYPQEGACGPRLTKKKSQWDGEPQAKAQTKPNQRQHVGFAMKMAADWLDSQAGLA